MIYSIFQDSVLRSTLLEKVKDIFEPCISPLLYADVSCLHITRKITTRKFLHFVFYHEENSVNRNNGIEYRRGRFLLSALFNIYDTTIQME